MTYHILLATLAGLALSACDAQSRGTAPEDVSALSARPLLDAIAYPEGIAYNSAGVYYVASAADGAVTRVNLDDNTATLLVPGGRLAPAGDRDFPVALGIKLDESDRLWITGGVRGDLHIIDAQSGRTVISLAKPDGPASLLNDLALTQDAAYITDSSRPVLWRVNRSGGEIGALEPWLELETAIPYSEGPNLNGIVATPDGSTLVAVQMNTGFLWTIDVAERTATRIDLGGALLRGGDGLVLDGQRLYATLQDTHEVVAIDLAPGFVSGTIVGRLQDERFAAPATAFVEAGKLYVVVTQMNRFADNSAVRPFNVYEMPLSAIHPEGRP
ncbi:SMP-30/gluconolactonase/LRE family protein [Pseudoroseomonas globiformis]|uniref:SMP-30/gluconolactonase/LRE family protein n=1 Tax=Teichococcus globiformis TaxID=2307229 RepID=A0ABV7G6K1_9PROT